MEVNLFYKNKKPYSIKCAAVNEQLNTIRVDNQRTLTYSEYGSQNGIPILICHGLNSSRLEAKIVHQLISDENYRIIGIDRPGMGGSSFQENRTILDFTDDILHIADRLNIDKFTLIGTSAGAAYALACAYKLPQRVVSCHIISGLGAIEESFDLLSDLNKSFITMTKTLPWIIQPVFWLQMGRFSQNKNHSDKFLNNVIQSLDEVDKTALAEPKIRTLFVESFRESYANGSRGAAYDAILTYSNGWGFSLEDIKCKNIYLYNGGKDLSIPIEMGKQINRLIENSKYTIYKNDGHLSLMINQIEDIKQDITICWEAKTI